MDKALVFDTKFDMFSYFSAILDMELDVTTEHVSRFENLTEAMKREEYKYIFLTAEEEVGYSDFIASNIDVLENKTIVFYANNSKLYLVNPYTSKYENFLRVSNCILPKELAELLAKEDERSENQKEYFSLNTKFILNLETIPCDIFIKLSDNKYVKLYNDGDQFNDADKDSFKSKNLESIFLEKEAYAKFIEKLRINMMQENEAKGEKVSFAILGHEMVYDSINKLGLNEEAVEMASEAINSLEKIASKTKSFKNLLGKFLQKKNYIAEHSMMLTYLCIAMAKELGWTHENTINKLLVASFFHDILLDEKIAAKEGRDLKKIPPEEQKILKEHPIKASTMLADVDGVPMEVDKIILQHHEKPDGSGYPKGTTAAQIGPLSSLFIVAEDFISQLYKGDLNEYNIYPIFDELEGKYNEGNFIGPYQALKATYGISKVEGDFKNAML